MGEAGWKSSKPAGWTYFISHRDMMDIMKNFAQPEIRITDGDATGLLLQEQVSWGTLSLEADADTIDLSSWAEGYQNLEDVEGKDDWQGLAFVVPAGDAFSFEIVDAQAPALSFTMQDSEWTERSVSMAVRGNGDYSMRIGNLEGGMLKNIGFFASKDESIQRKHRNQKGHRRQ